jgi:hypothetical protein
VNRPFFKNDEITLNLSQETLINKFRDIFIQPKDKAFRRNFFFWSKKYEEIRVEEINARRLLKKEHWRNKVLNTAKDIKAYIPCDSIFVLVDENTLNLDDLLDKYTYLPFLEKDAQYFGCPADDSDAINEIERQKKAGVKFIVLTWPSFWMLEYYKDFGVYLYSKYTCILANEHLMIFDLKYVKGRENNLLKETQRLDTKKHATK